MTATAPKTLAAQVRAALGFHRTEVEEEETDTRVSFWSTSELNDAYALIGGTVTAQRVVRTRPHYSYRAIEITVTGELPGLGEVQAFTDWLPEDGGLDLPVMQALPEGLLRNLAAGANLA